MLTRNSSPAGLFVSLLSLFILLLTPDPTAGVCRTMENEPQNFKCDWWEDLEVIRNKELVQELIIRNEMPFMCNSASFVRFPRIKTLRLANGMFMNVGKDCFNGLKDIVNIDLKNNDLNEFHFDSLNGSTIEYLTLTSNLLRSLHVEGVVLPKLRHLILSKNQLETLYVVSDSMPRIIDLSADNNHIHTFFIVSDSVHTLRLSENDITGFGADNLKSHSLAYLYMQNNRMRRVSLDAFKNLPKVLEIFLDGNPLEVLDGSSQNLTEFSLYQDMIIMKGVHRAAFSIHVDWWKIQQLVFSSNNIRSFNSLRRLQNAVQELNLDHNELTAIGGGDLGMFSKLFVLDMSYNRISTIHYEAFDHLTRLHTLNLAHNCIQHMSGLLFESLRSITTVSLATNLLTYFPLPGWDNTTNLITQRDYHVSIFVVLSCNAMNLLTASFSYKFFVLPPPHSATDGHSRPGAVKQPAAV